MRGRFFRPSRTQIKPWYERNSGRLSSDRAIVAELYPSLQFCLNEESASASLEGSVVIRDAECGIPTDISTLVKFPRDYPANEPAAYDAQRRFKPWPYRDLKERHIAADTGKCCLWLHPRSEWVPADPRGLGHFLDQLIVFFERQLIYDETGKWPGPAYGHEREGYIEFIREQLGDQIAHLDKLLPLITLCSRVGPNDTCPCGSGIKFKKCHLRLIEKIQAQIGVTTIWAQFHPNKGR